MNIGFVLIPYQQYSGVGEYCRNLFKHLIEMDKENQYTVFLPSDTGEAAVNLLGRENCVITKTPSSPSFLRYSKSILLDDTIERHRPRIDLLHCFSFPVPKFTGTVMLTVHDLKENDLPELFNPVKNTIRMNLVSRSLRRADHIIAVSNFTMDRLIHHYPFCDGKVSRIYHGFSNTFSYDSSIPSPHSKPYILTVGHIVSHKNHRNLILAFNKLLDRPDFEHDLVIIGRNYSSKCFFESLKSLCAKPERVIFTGTVSNSQLTEYYKHAALFVFPSLYEGFGIPLLEVSFHRVPFVVSNIEVFKELLDFPKAQFDPDDPDDIAAVIHKHLANPSLRRETLDWAAIRFSSFSWTNTARETLQLYEKLMDSRRNIDPLVVRDFGFEWQRFDQSKLNPIEQEEIFSEYFANFPWQDLPKNAIGLDLGCGSGRWAVMVAPHVAELHCIDPSLNAINVTRKNLAAFNNCKFHQAGAGNIPLPDNSLDFAYSLGVLHHVPDAFKGIQSCVKKLKPGAPLLLYIYYALENRPLMYKKLWILSDSLRNLIAILPYSTRYTAAKVIAFLFYWPMARFSRMLEKTGINVEHYPLSFYRNRSLYVMQTDALDRFGTRLEKRFTKEAIKRMMVDAGLQDVSFNAGPPYWVAVGTKK